VVTVPNAKSNPSNAVRIDIVEELSKTKTNPSRNCKEAENRAATVRERKTEPCPQGSGKNRAATVREREIRAATVRERE
jgi:hypothetical protein